MAYLAHDTQKRRNNIARLWAEDGVFVDHNSRYEEHSGIDHAVAGLVEKFPNFVFTERGELQAFNGVGKLDWGFGPAGEEVVITGIDVLVMRGDTIGALYTFPDVFESLQFASQGNHSFRLVRWISAETRLCSQNRRALPDCRELGPQMLSFEVDRIPWNSEPMRQNAEYCFELLAQVAAS